MGEFGDSRDENGVKIRENTVCRPSREFEHAGMVGIFELEDGRYQNMYLRRKSWLALCLMALFLAGCGQGSDEPVSVTPPDVDDPQPSVGEVVINDMDAPTDQWGSDPYKIGAGADAPVIKGDTLTLTVSYGGGCADHAFTLVADGEFQESDPVRLGVSLAHNANGDMCEAYLTEEYEFDLTPVKTLYQQTYGEDAGTVVLVFESGLVDVDPVYEFES